MFIYVVSIALPQNTGPFTVSGLLNTFGSLEAIEALCQKFYLSNENNATMKRIQNTIRNVQCVLLKIQLTVTSVTT